MNIRLFRHIIILTCISIFFYSCGTGRNAVTRGSTIGQRHSGDNETAISNTNVPKKKSGNLSGVAGEIVKEARTWIGTPYAYGGHTRKGTDCSGMVMEVYLKVLNLKLPRTAQEQQKYCTSMTREDLRPGDLIFFSPSKGSRVSHVGIYTGNNNMIHASSSRGVIESNIYERWYDQHYHSSGYILSLEEELQKQDNESSELERMIEMKTDSILSTYMD